MRLGEGQQLPRRRWEQEGVSGSLTGEVDAPAGLGVGHEEVGGAAGGKAQPWLVSSVVRALALPPEGSTPRQGHVPGLQVLPWPWPGRVWPATSPCLAPIGVSLSLPPTLPL